MMSPKLDFGFSNSFFINKGYIPKVFAPNSKTFDCLNHDIARVQLKCIFSLLHYKVHWRKWPLNTKTLCLNLSKFRRAGAASPNPGKVSHKQGFPNLSLLAQDLATSIVICIRSHSEWNPRVRLSCRFTLNNRPSPIIKVWVHSFRLITWSGRHDTY